MGFAHLTCQALLHILRCQPEFLEGRLHLTHSRPLLSTARKRVRSCTYTHAHTHTPSLLPGSQAPGRMAQFDLLMNYQK